MLSIYSEFHESVGWTMLRAFAKCSSATTIGYIAPECFDVYNKYLFRATSIDIAIRNFKAYL